MTRFPNLDFLYYAENILSSHVGCVGASESKDTLGFKPDSIGSDID